MVLKGTYEQYVGQFNQAFIQLLTIAPTVNSVNTLPSEDEQLEFIKAFRELMRVLNVLKTFTQFTFDDLSMNEQSFADYKSKYLDLYEQTKGQHQKEKVSILNDIDFELELIHRDEINVAYILKLLAKMKQGTPEERERQRKSIVDLLSGDVQLRSKRELIEKFIQENLPHIEDPEDIADEFFAYWDEEQQAAIQQLVTEENLDEAKTQKVIGDYLFTEQKPLRDDIIDAMKERPSLRERGTTAERITARILDFVETFISGMVVR